MILSFSVVMALHSLTSNCLAATISSFFPIFGPFICFRHLSLLLSSSLLLDSVRSYSKSNFRLLSPVEETPLNRPFPPTFAIWRKRQKLRYWVGFLASYLHHWKLPSELLETAVYVRINWCFFEFTSKIRSCCFRMCTFQYFLLFDVITAIDLLGRCVRWKKVCAPLLRETPFIHSAVTLGSKVLKLV